MSNYIKNLLCFFITLLFVRIFSQSFYTDNISDRLFFSVFLVIFFIFIYLITIKVFNFLYIDKKWKNYIKADLYFIFVICCILIVPILQINHEPISINENRTLALYKPLFEKVSRKLKINYNFPKDFEKWFNDRFFSRTFLINLYNSKFLLKSEWTNDIAIKSKDNWLFCNRKKWLDNYQNIDLFTEKELKYVFEYFNTVNEYCKNNSKKFYLVIIPNKSRIYHEYMPSYLYKKPDTKSRTNQLIKYVKDKSDIKILYPYELLMQNKSQELLYYKTDTHWNDLGASLVYDEIIKTLQKDNFKIEAINYKNTAKYEEYIGDIIRRLPCILKYKDKHNYIKYDLPKDYKENILGLKIDTYNNTKKYNLYMNRDSFTIRLRPFISNTFKHVTYNKSYQVNLSEMKEADIVIFQIVERNLHVILEKEIPTLR